MTRSDKAPPVHTRALLGGLIGGVVGFLGFLLLTLGFGWASMYPMVLVGFGAGLGAMQAARRTTLRVVVVGVVMAVTTAVAGLALLGAAEVNPFFLEMTPEAIEEIRAAPLRVPMLHLVFASAVSGLTAALSVIGARLLPFGPEG